MLFWYKKRIVGPKYGSNNIVSSKVVIFKMLENSDPALIIFLLILLISLILIILIKLEEEYFFNFFCLCFIWKNYRGFLFPKFCPVFWVILCLWWWMVKEFVFGCLFPKLYSSSCAHDSYILDLVANSSIPIGWDFRFSRNSNDREICELSSLSSVLDGVLLGLQPWTGEGGLFILVVSFSAFFRGISYCWPKCCSFSYV